MDEVSDFQQRLAKYQNGIQFGAVRVQQQQMVQGNSPFTYYPQGMSVSQNRFQAPNAGIRPKLGGDETPRYGANPSIGNAIEKGIDKMESMYKKQSEDNTQTNQKKLRKQIPVGPVQQDNEDDSYMDAVYSTTTQGKDRVSAKNQGLADAMDEVAAEMDDRPDMSGAKGFRGGFQVGYTDNQRNVTNNPSKGMIVGAAVGMGVRAFKSRAQSRSKPSPAEAYRAGESEKSNTNDDFDWGV